MRSTWVAAALAVGITAACEPAPEQAPRGEADIVAEAGAVYDPAAYDTVAWTSDEEAIARGSDIFKWACADCHGPEGRGDGGRVIDGDTLHPPSFLAADWEYADDPDALHRKVFIGNTLGMPHWGLRQMRPRDIVAVERYIRQELRTPASE
ncbi:MAG TPA: c-type cytochrome [Longimicrobiales bacterium]|nr:c-type cytochrome [Longimicrobiales bacterium]